MGFETTADQEEEEEEDTTSRPSGTNLKPATPSMNKTEFELFQNEIEGNLDYFNKNDSLAENSSNDSTLLRSSDLPIEAESEEEVYVASFFPRPKKNKSVLTNSQVNFNTIFLATFGVYLLLV